MPTVPLQLSRRQPSRQRRSPTGSSADRPAAPCTGVHRLRQLLCARLQRGCQQRGRAGGHLPGGGCGKAHQSGSEMSVAAHSWSMHPNWFAQPTFTTSHCIYFAALPLPSRSGKTGM